MTTSQIGSILATVIKQKRNS